MSELAEVTGMLVLWAALVVLGAAVSYHAYRAWRSSRERSLGFLAAGFLALSVVAGVAWFSLYFMGEDIWVCEAGSTGFSVIGFGVILYALRSRLG